MRRIILDTWGPLPAIVRLHNALPGWLQPAIRWWAHRAAREQLARACLTEVRPGEWLSPKDKDGWGYVIKEVHR